MTPTNQTTFGVPGGNCFSACVASILDLPIKEVPYFMTSNDWWDGFLAWCHSRGVDAIFAEYKQIPKTNDFKSDLKYYTDLEPIADYFILIGNNPEGQCHATIGLDGDMIFDPNPHKLGLISCDGVIFLLKK